MTASPFPSHSQTGRARIFATRSSFEEKCAQARTATCYHELVTLIGAISGEKPPSPGKKTPLAGTRIDPSLEAKKTELFLELLDKHINAPVVATQLMFHLTVPTVSATEQRKAIHKVIREQCTSENVGVHNRAYSALVKLPEHTPDELHRIARALNSRYPQLQHAVGESLRDLDAFQLQLMIAANAPLVAEKKPHAADLTQALLSAKQSALNDLKTPREF
jgi:hypothetical protein